MTLEDYQNEMDGAAEELALSKLQARADVLYEAAVEAIAFVEQALEGVEDTHPDHQIVEKGNAALAAYRNAHYSFAKVKYR